MRTMKNGSSSAEKRIAMASAGSSPLTVYAWNAAGFGRVVDLTGRVAAGHRTGLPHLGPQLDRRVTAVAVAVAPVLHDEHALRRSLPTAAVATVGTARTGIVLGLLVEGDGVAPTVGVPTVGVPRAVSDAVPRLVHVGVGVLALPLVLPEETLGRLVHPFVPGRVDHDAYLAPGDSRTAIASSVSMPLRAYAA